MIRDDGGHLVPVEAVIVLAAIWFAILTSLSTLIG
jgi:hypothetical protein